MNTKKQTAEVIIISGVRVDFDYAAKNSNSLSFYGSGTVFIKEPNPSDEKIKQAVETYVSEKAVIHLAKSEVVSVDLSITITNTSKITTNVSITPA